jgi:hypothetical protein
VYVNGYVCFMCVSTRTRTFLCHLCSSHAIFVCTCVYVYMIVPECTLLLLPNKWVCMFICMYPCAYIWTSSCMHTYLYLYVHSKWKGYACMFSYMHNVFFKDITRQ